MAKNVQQKEWGGQQYRRKEKHGSANAFETMGRHWQYNGNGGDTGHNGDGWDGWDGHSGLARRAHQVSRPTRGRTSMTTSDERDKSGGAEASLLALEVAARPLAAHKVHCFEG